MGRKKTPILPITSLNINRYTSDAWLKTYPSSDEYEWAERTVPYNIYDFISQMLTMIDCSEMPVNKYDRIRLVTLDNKYFDYLKEQNLENSPENRARYASQHPYTDEELLEMAKKAGLDKAYTLLTIPAVMIREEITSQSSNYKLNTEQIEKLTRYLEKIHGKGNVFVYGNFVRLEDLVNHTDKFYANGNLYFEKGIRFEMSEYRKQRYDCQVNVAFLGIPFLVKSPVKKVYFEMDELDEIFESLEYTPELIEALLQEEFEEFNVKAPDFDKTTLFKELTKDETINIMPMQVPLNEIDELVAEMMEGFGME